ncbi:MAG: hypothetical protein ACI94Y_004005 [Maribacter sp.]|jgi:hypothetical protein
MKRILLFVLLCCSIQLMAQQEKFTISGYIEDAGSGEKLIESNVFDDVSISGTVSNLYGFYSITLPKDTVKLSFSYIGYSTQSYEIYLNKDITIDIKLGEITELSTVTVTADKLEERFEEQTQMSRIDVPIAQIKKIPALLGEVDVMKALQLLPGVQSGGEGTSGLYVRGGSPDQNLVLLDGVPVYNVSHLFGFFSVFNADAIRNVTLTKGGFPARYGGRLSSVLDINMKEGNDKEFHGEGSIGLIAAKATVEGPIWKDKTSFIVSGRRTYIDLLTRPIIKSQADGNVGGYYFYDVNAKVNHKFNKKHRLYASTYLGQDVFYLNVEDKEDGFSLNSGFDWGNTTAALRWNYMMSNKLFANTAVTYSRYQFDLITEQSDASDQSFAAKYTSNIKDFGVKIDFDYMPSPNHYVRFGLNAINHTFKPGALQFNISDGDDFNTDTIIGTQNTTAWEYFMYVEDDFKIGKNFSTNLGFHLSAFSVEDKTYAAPQARVGMRYLLPKGVAIKASYSMMTQYIHLLTNEGVGLPTDLWVPSTAQIKPQRSWQAALGLAKTFGADYEVSIEGYYKKMDNLLSYKEGASFLSFDDWQEKVEQGQGDSYGAEFFVQKKKGKTTGWIGYTLSWNNRQFENINSGEEYPFKYDRRHDLSVVVSHEFNDRISLAGTWIYGTGNSITLNEARYFSFDPSSDGFGEIYGEEVGVPGSKNNYRMKSYHRLDVGVNFTKQKKRYQRTFSIGTYNTYNRRNPFFIYYDDGNDKTFKQVSIFPLIPYFTWSFKF